MSSRAFEVRFAGPGMRDGAVPVDQLAHVLEGFQDAVRHMVAELVGRSPSPGPLPDEIRDAATIELTGTRAGSLVCELVLAERDEARLVDLGSQAVDLVFDGLSGAVELPPTVERSLHEIRRALTPAIDEVEFIDLERQRRTSLRRGSTDVSSSLEAPGVERRQVRGRVLEVDWKDHTAELHSPTGVVRVSFDEQDAHRLRAAALQAVVVEGEYSETPITREGRLVLESLEIVQRSDDRFWHPADAATLAVEQGVGPFRFEGELRGADDPGFDEFLRATQLSA